MTEGAMWGFSLPGVGSSGSVDQAVERAANLVFKAAMAAVGQCGMGTTGAGGAGDTGTGLCSGVELQRLELEQSKQELNRL